MMDTPATLWKHPASSPLNAKACQPTASVESISPPRTWRHLALGPHALPRNGGRNHERNCHIPHITKVQSRVLPCAALVDHF